MILRSLSRCGISSRRQPGRCDSFEPRHRLLQMFVDRLEQRTLLATFAVTEFSDAPVVATGDLPGSLRQAIFDANSNPGADVIEFALSPGTIILNAGPLEITDDLVINGPGSDDLTISGNDVSQVLVIDDGVAFTTLDVQLNDVSLVAGNATFHGGAIDSSENLTLRRVIVADSRAAFGGGGISSTVNGVLTIIDSTITGNSTGFDGGGISVNVNSYGSLMISGSSITGNSAGRLGGGMDVRNNGNVTISSTRIFGNDAADRGGGFYAHVYGSLDVSESTISGNSSDSDGGGVALEVMGLTGYAVVRDSVLSGNSAGSSGSRGGGIFSHNAGTTRVIGSTISGNVAVNGGGGHFFTDSTGASTILGSTIAGNSAAGAGGLNLRTNGFLYLGDSHLLGNTAGSEGGGVTSVNYGVFTASRCTISHNTVFGPSPDNRGGGIFNYTAANALTTINDSTISGNSVEDDGGGVYALNYGNFFMNGSTVSGNASYYSGGGIYAVNFASLSIFGSKISHNLAANGRGGGLHLYAHVGATTTISGCTVSANDASASGGGIRSTAAGSLTLSDSTVFGNSGSFGGGIDLYSSTGGDSTLVNTTISGNEASFGGGIHAYSTGSMLITNSTLTGNTAFNSGGGLRLYAFGTDIDVSNSIIAGNVLFLNTPDDIAGDLAALNIDYSLIGAKPATVTGSGLISGTVGSPYDPMLGPLDYNGGPTRTHALLTGSAAIDSGDNSLLPAMIVSDQRGFPNRAGTSPFPRVLGILSATPQIDMGAFETQDPGGSFEDVNDNGFWDFGSDILLNSGELDDGMHTVHGGSGLVLTASTLIAAPKIRLIADGSIRADTNLIASSSSIFLRSRDGSVQFHNLAADASSFFRVRAKEHFLAGDRNVILAGSQIDVHVWGAVDVHDSVLRADTKIRLRGEGDIIAHDAVIETTTSLGRVTLRSTDGVMANDAEVTAGRKLWLKAGDLVSVERSRLTSDGTAGEVRAQAGQSVLMRQADVRATRTIYVRSTRSSVIVEDATVGILDGSNTGTIWLQSRDNVFLAGSLIRAPGTITIVGAPSDESLANIGTGTLPAV